MRTVLWIGLLGVATAAGPALGDGASGLANGEFTADVNGIKLWYKASGKGPACVMPSPSWGISSDLYSRTLRSMEDRFTMVYVDARGTGRSGGAKSAEDYTWGHLVGDLEGLRTISGRTGSGSWGIPTAASRSSNTPAGIPTASRG